MDCIGRWIVWVDGWLDRCLGGWVDRWMSGGWVDGWLDKFMDGWMG